MKSFSFDVWKDTEILLNYVCEFSNHSEEKANKYQHVKVKFDNIPTFEKEKYRSLKSSIILDTEVYIDDIMVLLWEYIIEKPNMLETFPLLVQRAPVDVVSAKLKFCWDRINGEIVLRGKFNILNNEYSTETFSFNYHEKETLCSFNYNPLISFLRCSFGIELDENNMKNRKPYSILS